MTLPLDPMSRLLYVIGVPESGTVKIGATRNIGRRLGELRTKSEPTRLPEGIDRKRLALLYQRPGGMPLERALHARFQPLRIFGEWFDLGPGAVLMIRAVADEISPIDY